MRFRITLAMSLLLTSSAWALGVKAPFSAIAVQQLPGQAEKQAGIFVTADKVRMEIPAGQVARVEITDMQAGIAYVLLPSQRVYAQHQAAPAVIEQLQQSNRPATPCVMPSQAVCKKLGQETLFGRLADKWEMVVDHQGQQYRSQYWIDAERFMPLRQIWADGTVTELRPMGREVRAGRDTEKWQLLTRSPDGKTQSAEQWFDTQLQIMIAEVIPGGYRRELRDIKVAAQPPELFRVPPGYHQVAPQMLMPSAQGQQRRP